MTIANIADAGERIRKLKAETSKAFVGQQELIDGVIAALFSGGHVLIEGVPGLGKTLLVRALGKTLGCKFSRIQFTPDLMPSDITGSHIYNQAERKFFFKEGPIFTNLLLADEINRAPAKTHSALLEIMQEMQATIDNTCYNISPPFLVLATQNPVESEGTYNLPEAQLDRFLLKLNINYPREEEELEILRLNSAGEQFENLDNLQSVMNPDEVLACIRIAGQVKTEDSILGYINMLVRASRSHRDVYLGCSPRAGVALIRTARVSALMEGRDYVIPDDVKRMTLPAFRHRILLSPEAEVEGRQTESTINDILDSVAIPRGS